MEALESDGDEEIISMVVDDTEMIHLPEGLCADLEKGKRSTDLPADIYTRHDMISPK
jgi:hypothetical protein